MQPDTLRPQPWRRESPSSDSLVVRVGKALGWRESTTSQRLWGPDSLNQRCARVVVVFRTAGADEALQRWLAPIDLARTGEAPRLTDELRIEEEQADAAEAVAQVAYDRCESRETAAALVRKLDAEIASSVKLRHALAARWAL